MTYWLESGKEDQQQSSGYSLAETKLRSFKINVKGVLEYGSEVDDALRNA